MSFQIFSRVQDDVNCTQRWESLLKMSIQPQILQLLLKSFTQTLYNCFSRTEVFWSHKLVSSIKFARGSQLAVASFKMLKFILLLTSVVASYHLNVAIIWNQNTQNHYKRKTISTSVLETFVSTRCGIFYWVDTNTCSKLVCLIFTTWPLTS